MEILGKLFGSMSRVKIMRLFLFHPNIIFDIETIKKRTRATKQTIRKELNLLEKVGFITRTSLTSKKDLVQKGGGASAKQKSSFKPNNGYRINSEFPYIEPLRGILVNSESLKSGIMKERIEASGKMKLVIAAGVFIGSPESRVDLFIVGNKIKKRELETYLRSLEADIGCDLIYTVMDLKEFNYRKQVYDRLVRDVLDYPHEKIIDRL